jgi:predicted dehydrogenase
MKIHFAAVGFDHGHIFGQTECLLQAGAELVWFWDNDPERIAQFRGHFPQGRLARSVEEILEDETIHLIASAAVPDERAPLGIRAMQHGKDYFSDKPAFATLVQLEEVKQVQAETKRKYVVYFSERLANAATVKAGELVQAGAIGQVVQTVGFGPHRLFGPDNQPRPEWTFHKQRYGGIINDLATHQIDQFLFFTDSKTAEVVSARTANIKFTQYPAFEDFGELLLQSGEASGFIRVDWYTPDGLPTWGDVRLFIVGTEGYMEVRKNVDLNGRPQGNHLFLADKQKVQYIDCRNYPLPFGSQLVHDLQTREETAVTQTHTFTVSELALQAQQLANPTNTEGARNRQTFH